MTDKTHVSIRHIAKVYPDGTKALHDINVEIKEGEIVVLLGPSGCGKSTLLRMIGGLEDITSGEMYFYDKEISGVPVEKRSVGFVFQNYALFPTMTVRENIGFGLRLRKMGKHDTKKRVDSLIEMMDLGPYADKKPKQLSGGQQQRVAIARVLAIEPSVLLLDEPLTALDAKLKEHLRVELGLMLRRLGITTIYVTHDQLEAMAIADRIAIMNHGVIEQVDTPENIYASPKTEFVAEFIGSINRLKGRIERTADGPMVDLGFAKLPYFGSQSGAGCGDVCVYVRPEDIEVVCPEAGADHVAEWTVEQKVFMGDHCRITARYAEHVISFETSNTTRLHAGDPIRVRIDTDKWIVL